MSEMTHTARAAADRPWPESTQPEDGSGWGRIAALAGVVFVATSVVGSFLPGAPPASDAPTAKVVAFFQDHSGALKAQMLLSSVGVIALLWWFGALWRIMNRAEGGRPRFSLVAAVSLPIGVALALMSGLFTATAAFRPGSSAEIIQLLWTATGIAIAGAGLPLFAFLASVSILTYRTRMLPVWTSYVSGLAAVALLIGAIGVGTDSGVVNAFGLIGFLVWCLWILAVTPYLWRGAAAA